MKRRREIQTHGLGRGKEPSHSDLFWHQPSLVYISLSPCVKILHTVNHADKVGCSCDAENVSFFHLPPAFCQIKTDMAAQGKVRRKLTETWATNHKWQVLRRVVVLEVIVCYLRESGGSEGWDTESQRRVMRKREGETRTERKYSRSRKGKWQNAERAAHGHTEPTCMLPTVQYIELGGQTPSHVKHITRPWQWYHRCESCSLTVLLQSLQMVAGHTWASFTCLDTHGHITSWHRKSLVSQATSDDECTHAGEHQPLCCCSHHWESSHSASSETCPAQTVVSCPAERKRRFYDKLYVFTLTFHSLWGASYNGFVFCKLVNYLTAEQCDSKRDLIKSHQQAFLPPQDFSLLKNLNKTKKQFRVTSEIKCYL